MPRGPQGGGRGARSGNVDKPKNRKQTLLRLWKYLYQHKLMVFAALALTLISNSLALIGPTLAGWAIDAIGTTPGQVQFPLVFRYCGFMLLFYVISSALSYVLAVLMIHLSQRVAYRMRQDVFNKLSILPVKYFDSHQTGEIVSKISYDIDTVNASLSTDLLQIATSVITVLGSFVMMVYNSAILVTIFLVTIPISILFTRYMTRLVRPLFRTRSQKLAEMNGYVEEVISGQKTTKSYHQEETMIDRFDQKNEAAVNSYYRADYYGSMTGPSVNFINNLSLSLVSMFGALLFLLNKLTLGKLSSFVLYSRKFSGPINEIANIIADLQSACAAAERVFALIDENPEPEDVPEAQELQNPKGHVQLEHVRFGYDADKTIIHDLSLEAKPGSTVAIVGPTGAGKTTIINLLMRFYDPQGGRILVDGQDIRQLTRKSLRRAYSMVLQDTWLFHGTIAENIAYGRPDASREEIVAAAKAAHIDHFISRLPQGYDTLLNEDGLNISQGQKQLLTIARAMLMQSQMLILDEATSNVDTRTEIQIQAAMAKLMEGKTCFVIAHRLSTIQHADTILVVQQGDIVEKGKHQELLEKGGVYANLYRSQFH